MTLYTKRALSVVTWADQIGEYCYHIEVDQSVVDAGYDAIVDAVDMRNEYEWAIAVFDGHINCIFTDSAERPRLNPNPYTVPPLTSKETDT